MIDTAWTVAEAKAKFSEVLDRAQQTGPQPITRNGKLAAVVVSAEEWARKTQRVGNLAEFFAASPGVVRFLAEADEDRAAVADACGVLLGRGRRIGRPAATADALIGATGVIHELTVVTRNVDHFKPLGVATHNPWRSKI